MGADEVECREWGGIGGKENFDNVDIVVGKEEEKEEGKEEEEGVVDNWSDDKNVEFVVEVEVEVEVEVTYEKYAVSIRYSKEVKRSTVSPGIKIKFVPPLLTNGIDMDFIVRMYRSRLQLWLNADISLLLGFLNKIINLAPGRSDLICFILS